MNIKLVNIFVSLFVEFLRNTGVFEIKVGNISELQERVPFGEISVVIRGAANTSRLSLALNFETKSATGVAYLLRMKEFSAIDQEVTNTLLQVAARFCDEAKKKLSEQRWTSTFDAPTALKPDAVNIPDFKKAPFLSVPLHSEYGKILLEINTTDM